MATTKTYPVPAWVRTTVCLVTFALAIVVVLTYLSTGRGLALLAFVLTSCAAVIKHVLTKQ